MYSSHRNPERVMMVKMICQEEMVQMGELEPRRTGVSWCRTYCACGAYGVRQCPHHGGMVPVCGAYGVCYCPN